MRTEVLPMALKNRLYVGQAMRFHGHPQRITVHGRSVRLHVLDQDHLAAPEERV